MSYLFDFAKCPCGHSMPVRPSTHALPEDDQKWSAKGVTVACSKCKRVATFEMEELESKQTPDGLSPYIPDAPRHRFVALLQCDKAGCKTPLQIFAIRNTSTTAEVLQEEKADWWWEDLTCPKGHALPDRKKAER
jgi:hypothetical protein